MKVRAPRTADRSGAERAPETQITLASNSHNHPSALYSFQRSQGEGGEISGRKPALGQESGNSVPVDHQEPLLFDVAFVERTASSTEDRWAKLVALLTEIGGSQ
jgi:hypothetical protein